ncbi:MAG: hypothetical protein HRU25_02660 [Psychrobium sp.]|nr:hypothetical protein [Psychrobium sp.]
MASHKTIDTEVLTIGQFALGFLTQDRSVSLPKKIHDMLQNVLTKRGGDALRYREAIVLKVPVKDPTSKNTERHQVIRNRSYAIFNILCLYAFMDTKNIKCLFQHYYETRHDPSARDFSMLHQQQQSQYLAYFCFGIDMAQIAKIEHRLLDVKFDLFTQKLPSPFNENSEGDLSPLLIKVSEAIDWTSYRVLYQQAEDCFEQKDFCRAKSLLTQLDQQALITLPVVDSLRRKISRIEDESQEAFDYLQNLLN